MIVTRMDNEMSLAWAKTNPSLFVDRFARFQEEYPVDLWTHSIDMSRRGFVILTAKRREVPRRIARVPLDPPCIVDTLPFDHETIRNISELCSPRMTPDEVRLAIVQGKWVYTSHNRYGLEA